MKKIRDSHEILYEFLVLLAENNNNNVKLKVNQIIRKVNLDITYYKILVNYCKKNGLVRIIKKNIINRGRKSKKTITYFHLTEKGLISILEIRRQIQQNQNI